MEITSFHLLLIAVVLFFGVALNRFSKFLKMPILLCFLVLGIICGKYGLNLFPNLAIADVQEGGEIALCFIMFAGGLETSFKAIKSVFVTGTVLATVGVVLTALVMAAAAWFISAQLDMFYTMSFALALMAMSTIASTDAAAVFAILRGQKASINPRLQSLLEYESGSNDPAAFLLTVIMIGVVQASGSFDFLKISWNIATGVVWGLGMGAVAGVLCGIFGQWFYNWIDTFLEYNGLRFVVCVAFVIFCYAVTDFIFHANVLMACYVAGITMGNLRFMYKWTVTKFHDGLSWLMQMCLFTSLGLFFDYHVLFNFRNMLGAVLVSLILMFIARPAVVMLCMIRSPFTMKERLFTSWVGIRGSAPVMLAATCVAACPFENETLAINMFNMVFTVVLLSILFQGSSIMWAAQKLGLVMPYEEKNENLLSYNERPDGQIKQEFTISPDNMLIGHKIQECQVRNCQAILLLIKRNNTVLRQTPDVVFQIGDILSFLGSQKDIAMMHHQFFADEEYSYAPTFRRVWKVFIMSMYKKISKLFYRGRKHE